MSSTSSAGTLERFSASLIAALANSKTSTSMSEPRRAVAMAVRAAATMTASPMTAPSRQACSPGSGPASPSSYPDVRVRLGDARLLTQRGLEVAYVVLGLLEQRAQRLGDVGQAGLARLLVPLPVAVELLLLELEVELEGAAGVGLARDLGHVGGG